MYCVIQKVKNRKPNPYGEYKELKVSSTTWTMGNETKTRYYYNYGDERFERPIKDAYKINIHKSYRENRKIKKKQWVICTMSYYDFLDSWPGDHVLDKELDRKLQEMGIAKDQLWDIVYKKLDPIIEQVKYEYSRTEEYKVQQKHRDIFKKYNAAKAEFEAKYGKDTYDYCFDVFGVLRNEEYLKMLETSYQAQQEYNNNYSSYYENNYSNYNYNSYSSYQDIKQNNYTDEEKEMLKKIYRVLALKFHPDKNNGEGGEIMNLVNKLKEEWEI